MYELHKLLWDIRKDPKLAERFLEEPEPILEAYGVSGEAAEALTNFDFKKLHEIGANPYLIYFCAIQLQYDRAAYYAQIRGE
jgi:hypothetical protein